MKTIWLMAVVWALAVATGYGQGEKAPQAKNPQEPDSTRGLTQYSQGLVTVDRRVILAILVQVADENNALVELVVTYGHQLEKQKRETVWVEMPTDGLVDDTILREGSNFEKVGTKTYATAAGSKKTIPRWRLISEKELLERQVKAEREAQAAAEAERAAEEARLTRTWTDANGAFSVTAKFVKFTNSSVYLLKQDGKEIQVLMSRLSKADQEWVRTELKSRKATKPR